MLGDCKGPDLGEKLALAAWLMPPFAGFFLIPMTMALAWHVAAAIAMPVATFAWATRRTNRSSRKRTTLRVFRYLLQAATSGMILSSAVSGVVIGLFSFSKHWPLVAALVVLAVMLRGMLWAFDQWVTRDWQRFGRLHANGLPVIPEMTMKEYAAAMVTSRQRNRQLAPAIGFWGELLVDNRHSDILAAMTSARRLLDATAAP